MKKLIVESTKNPIIPRMGVCDPHMHVFEGRVWMYASHDAVPGSSNFCMHDWQIWSSDDLIKWRLESVIRPEDFYMGASDKCWAVDCAHRNGKYYYYFSDGNRHTGVLVGDTPAGPFKDVLGKHLLDGTLTTTREYDPCVFGDDDGEFYLVFGGPKWCYGEQCGYYIAKLNEDMISFAETPRPIELDHMADDKASLNKFNGKYYLTYGGFYAISDCVYGPYKFMGHTGASIDHTSYFEWNSQIYNAITVEDHYGNYRSSGLCYVHIKDNGELVTDPLIVEYGVGRYDSNWNKIEAEWYTGAQNVEKAENFGMPGFSIVCNQQAVLYYPNVQNLSDKVGVQFVGLSDTGECLIELRQNDENGELLGVAKFPRRDGKYTWNRQRKITINFDKPLPDKMNVCLVIKPDENATFTLDNFHFYSEAIDNP